MEEGCMNLVQWFKEPEKEGQCKSCSLASLVSLYARTLKENGGEEIANEIDSIAKDITADKLATSPENVAKALDFIKTNIQDDNLRAKLRELDCMAQTEKTEETEETIVEETITEKPITEETTSINQI